MIENLRSVSRVTEVNAVSEQMLNLFSEENRTDDAFLTNQFALLKVKSSALTEAIRRTKAESELEELDEVCDDKTRAIHYLTLGFLHHPDDSVRTAAESVRNIFEKYGLEMISKSYAEQSTLTKSLLKDLEAEDIKKHIALLPGMPLLITQLKAGNEAFDRASAEYLSELVKEGQKENATQIKKEVIDIINNKLVVYLRAMIQVDEARYGELTRTIAESIDANNRMVKRRGKRKSV